MIKETNTRVAITLPKKQLEWLKSYCKHLKISPSKFISWILVKRTGELYQMFQIEQDADYFNNLYKEELGLTTEELIKIANAKWLDD